MERIKATEYPLEYDYDVTVAARGTSLIVVHHTGGAADDDLSAEEIHAAHIALGWTAIGYHYVVRKSGAIELGRPRWAIGAHAEGENYDSVGIEICGNFDIAEPTAAQIEAAAMLVANLAVDYGLPIDDEHIVGHRDLNATSCPGDALYEKLPLIIGKANWYAYN